MIDKLLIIYLHRAEAGNSAGLCRSDSEALQATAPSLPLVRPAGALQAGGAPFVTAAAVSLGSQQHIATVPELEDEHGTEEQQPAPQIPAEPQQQQQQQQRQQQRQQPTPAATGPTSPLLEFAQPLAATPGAPAALLDVLRSAAAGWLSTEQVHHLLVHAESYGLPIATKPPWLPAGKLADEAFDGPES